MIIFKDKVVCTQTFPAKVHLETTREFQMIYANAISTTLANAINTSLGSCLICPRKKSPKTNEAKVEMEKFLYDKSKEGALGRNQVASTLIERSLTLCLESKRSTDPPTPPPPPKKNLWPVSLPTTDKSF